MNAPSPRPLALVTGASSGIGLAIAGELAERGYDLVVVAEEAAIDAPDLLGGAATPLLAIRADLSVAEGVVRIARELQRLGRPLDALVINAGVGVGGDFVESDIDGHLRVVDLNVRSAVHLTRLLLPEMVTRGEGRLMFTSSIAAIAPMPYQSTCAASKAFLSSFAEALRYELADSGVTVTALMPGPTDTDFFRRADIEDTKVAQGKKDDPRDVARDGVDAMLAGKDHVVAGSVMNKVQATLGAHAPTPVVTAAVAKQTKPGSGRSGS